MEQIKELRVRMVELSNSRDQSQASLLAHKNKCREFKTRLDQINGAIIELDSVLKKFENMIGSSKTNEPVSKSKGENK